MYRVKHGAVIGKKTFFLVCAQCKFPGYGLGSSSQSQRRIWSCTSNHGVSPNDSVNYNGWPLRYNGI